MGKGRWKLIYVHRVRSQPYGACARGKMAYCVACRGGVIHRLGRWKGESKRAAVWCALKIIGLLSYLSVLLLLHVDVLTFTSIAIRGVLHSGLSITLWFPVLVQRTLFSLPPPPVLKSRQQRIGARSLPATSYVAMTPAPSTERSKCSD